MKTDDEMLNIINLVTEDLESLEAAKIEMKEIYGQRLPYVRVLKIYGICYRWSDAFISGILLAMATDRLDQFSEDELDAWYDWVNFQDYHSHSMLDSDCNTVAIGCTVPDSNFKSFVVCENGTITEFECQFPRYDMMDEQVWASLDRAMMDLYNCEEIDNCGIEDTYDTTNYCNI